MPSATLKIGGVGEADFELAERTHCVRLASALLSALILTVPLLACAAFYSWYKKINYPEGTASGLLIVGAVIFVGLTCGILSDHDREEDEH